ncbi:ABC transporter substrate-binding protein [Rhodoblastus sp.]|uniref:ABC transporter substrate-binding protein n=1 Tax=Rhodoblastus sp. TaxID=1962975 RepID=UPI0035B02A9D
MSAEFELFSSLLSGLAARNDVGILLRLRRSEGGTKTEAKLRTVRNRSRRFQLRFRATCQILSLAYALVASDGIAMAQSDPQVSEFMAAINSSIAELAARSGADAAGICRRINMQVVNIDAIATNALGDGASGMSSRQRADYRAAALRWAIRDCVRMNGDNSGRPLTFVELRRGQSGGLLLATRSDQPSHTVVWRLGGPNRLKAFDVVVDGRSMTLALRDETAALLNRSDNNIDAAIVTLGR